MFSIYRQVGMDPQYKLWHEPTLNMAIYMNSDGGNIVFSDAVYEIRQGSVFFIAKGCWHYTVPVPPETYVRSKIYCSDELLKHVSALMRDSQSVHRFTELSVVHAQIPETLQSEVDALFMPPLLSDEHHAQCLHAANVLKLLTYMDAYAVEAKPLSVGFIGKTIGYINEHIRENITIEQIASEVNISKYHLCREFKKTVNYTIMEYILQTRLRLAADALLKETASIGEISEECGFSSQSYFCSAFKRHVGETPLAYRQRNRKG